MSLVNHRHSTYTSSLKNRVKVLDFIKSGGAGLDEIKNRGRFRGHTIVRHGAGQAG